MDLSDIQPIPNEPALLLKSKKILVIADLHIGLESQLRENGLNVTSQTKNMTDHILSLRDKYNLEEIILLGDIKHNIPSATISERRDVKKFLNTIKEHAKINIIPGNHDGFINKLATEDIIIHPSTGFLIENIGFIHGHRWPSEEIMQCDQIIMGHTHPTIVFTDRLEFRAYEPCWLKSIFISKKLKEKYPDAKCSDVLVMPAFNPLCGGIAANKQGITGPLGKIIDVKNAKVYLIDGTSIGKVGDIS